MIRNNDIIHGYTVLAVANGMILAHSATAPDPYVVWHTTEDGSGVYDGKYMTSKGDAEWDFCAKAFPWFEDNAPINIIEDKAAEKIDSFKWYLDGAKERVESCRSVLDEIQEAIDNATALVEDMVAEHEKLVEKKEAPQEESAEQEPFCTRDFAGRGHREIAAQSKKEQSNPIWTAAPRLAIDEHGISLSGVYLPGTTRFLLKDSGDLDGTFILDIETDVVLATAPGKSTVAEHENPVDKKETPQEENAEPIIDYISGFDFEMSAKIQPSVSDLLSKIRSKRS